MSDDLAISEPLAAMLFDGRGGGWHAVVAGFARRTFRSSVQRVRTSVRWARLCAFAGDGAKLLCELAERQSFPLQASNGTE